MRRILIVLFVLIVCLPMAIAFFLASSFAEEKIEAMMKVRAEHRFRVASNILRQKVDEIRLKAGIIAQHRNVRGAVESEDVIELIDLLNGNLKDLGLNSIAAGIEIYRADRTLLAGEPRHPELMANAEMVAETLSGMLSDRLFFKADRLFAAAGVPVYAQGSSQPVAALILSATIDEVMVDQIKSTADAEIVIFAESAAGLRLLASTIVENNRRTFPVIAAMNEEIPDVSSGGRRYLVRSGRYDIDNGSFYLAVAIEKSELLEILKSLRDVFVRTGAGALLLAMLVALALARLVTLPVKLLVEEAQKFGAGNLEDSPPITSQVPELQFLGETFAGMKKQIRARVAEIESAREALDQKVFDLSLRNLINQAIINKSEDSILKDLLEIVADTMRTRRSSMLLLDQGTNELALKVAVGRNESGFAPEPVRFAAGEGLAGYAARNGQAVFSNRPEEDPRFKPGKTPIKNLVCVPLFDEGRVVGVINVADRDEDFSDEDADLLQGVADQIAIALQKARLYELAITDGLTGLFIHRYFQMRLESEIARAGRGRETLALIMFDIDHFKKFNDTYGHQCGDRVIRLVADRVRKNIRDGIDIACRYGGEEFTVIMPETGREGVLTFAERLRHSVEQAEIEHEGQLLRVTISLGCALYPDDAATREALICNADSALYRSKKNGRNCVSCYGS